MMLKRSTGWYVIICFKQSFMPSDHKVWREHLAMWTLLLGLPCPDPTASTFFTTSFPSETLPKTVWRPSSQEVSAVVMKNWLPLVLGPALAIEMQKGSCLSLKFSSLNLGPQMDLPPVPSPLVKSPPWIMKLGMILWKVLPAYFRKTPLSTRSPWHSLAKFSTVLGTTWPKRSMTTSPTGYPAISMVKVALWVTVS